MYCSVSTERLDCSQLCSLKVKQKNKKLFWDLIHCFCKVFINENSSLLKMSWNDVLNTTQIQFNGIACVQPWYYKYPIVPYNPWPPTPKKYLMGRLGDVCILVNWSWKCWFFFFLFVHVVQELKTCDMYWEVFMLDWRSLYLLVCIDVMQLH